MTVKATQGARWRSMRPGDVAGAMAVADIVHPAFPEGAAMYESRIRLFPEGCRVLADAMDGIAGYALAYPARLGFPVALDTVLDRLPEAADALYLHDIAIRADRRGQGHAEEAIGDILLLAEERKLKVMLVSVYGTAPFWERFGFRRETLSAGKLASYGEGAVYMVRSQTSA